MINVDQITSRLAKMPDQALQQYASMHKEDPYIMALAVSESNRRKQMRSAAQGAQGQMEQPKVADQALAEMAPAPEMPMQDMLPEEQGIGQLPAGNMNFADGGIVAFAGGGDVERYQTGGGIFGLGAPALYGPELSPEAARRARLEAEARARAEARGVPLSPDEQVLYPEGSLMGRLQRGGIQFPEDSLLGRYQTNLAADPAVQATLAAERARASKVASPAAPAKPAAQGVIPMVAPQPAAQTYSRTMGDPGPARRPAPPAPIGDPGASGGTEGGRTSASASTSMSTRTPAGLGDLSGMFQRAFDGVKLDDPTAASRSALEAKELAAAQAAKDALVRDQAKFADAYKGREERLNKREASIVKDKDVNTGLAFLNAGLAIMSTPGNLGTAIGKGAQVGTAQYAAGLDKLRASQEKLDEARDRFEDLKLNRDEMSAKEIRAAESQIRGVGVEAEKRAVESIMKMYGVKMDVAKEMFKTQAELQLTQMREAGANSRAALAARTATARPQTPDQQYFDGLLAKHKGDRVAAYQEFASGKNEPTTREEAFKKWSDPIQRGIIQSRTPNVQTFDQYMTSLGVGAGAQRAGAGGWGQMQVTP